MPALVVLARVIARASPSRCAGFLALAVLRGLLGPAVIAASGLAVASAGSAYDLTVALVLVGAAFALGGALQPLQNVVAVQLGSVVAQSLRERLFDATLQPTGLAHLEDPEVADEIQRAGTFEWADLAPMTRIVQELGTAVTSVVTALGAAFLLFDLSWWAPLVLVLGAVSTHVWMSGDDRREVLERERHAGLERRAQYPLDLALDPPAAKEVRLFGLVGLLGDRYRGLREEYLTHIWRARRAGLRAVLLTLGSIGLTYGVVLAALAADTARGDVSAAELTVYIQAVFAVGTVAHPMLATWWVRQGAAALPHLLGLPKLTARGQLTTGSGSAEGLPRKEIRLSEVRFGYGRVEPVLDGLDLTIPVGSSLAIVGDNGAGKTTLLKLLTRMYDPDSGSIEADGQDLRTLDPASWRRQVAVIFQDFVRYELSAHDNIALGRTNGVRDAARRAGAAELVETLPDGWDTVLARQYRGGVDLSGGQWQRIALARALRAADDGARLLILDEPTAALDVRAEAELFERFLELTAGMTTILVTHRLSSVRYVDRIAVLGAGRIVEHGTHDELLARDGDYARMFRLQAERFRSGARA